MPSEPDHASDSRDATDAAPVEDNPSGAPEPAPKGSAVRFDPADRPKEYGGRKGPDPVRYGDWEKNGRCIDF